MKSVALFDFDNTLYDGFSYFDLLEKQTHEGLIMPEVLDSAGQVMDRYKEQILSYEDAIVGLLDIYADGLKGRHYEEVRESTHDFYHNTIKVHDFAKNVFGLLSSTHEIYLVTGEPQFIAESIVDIFDLDGYHSSKFEVKSDIFTGGVKSYLATRREKRNAVRHLLSGQSSHGSFAFGDSDGDIEMLDAAEHPICVNPNAGLLEKATEQGWPCLEPNQIESFVSGLLKSSPQLSEH